jgi:hypothetical protein
VWQIGLRLPWHIFTFNVSRGPDVDLRLFLAIMRRVKPLLERGSPEGWLPVALAGSTIAFASSMATYDALSFIQATFIIATMVALVALIRLPPAVTRRAEA